MVALKTPSLPPPEALLATLKAVPGIAVDLGAVEKKENGFILGLGRDHAAVALVPVPIPWSKLEGPCATAWWWPQAAEAMRGHSAHALVALAGETGNPLQRHITLTHLVAAVLSHTDAVGVYWGGGAVVHSPEAFLEQAQDFSPENLPIPLWIDFRVEPNDDGSHRLYTTGMNAFGKPEIEILHSAQQAAEIFNFASSIAEYVITRNPNIEAGHTVGRSPTEKIPATYGPSMWDDTLTVLRLEF